MRKKIATKATSLLFAILFIPLPLLASHQTKVLKLKCEYLTNPIGIDLTSPRLSWQLFSTERDEVQSAYEIRVASSIKGLAKPDRWQTGPVLSSESVNITYQGKPLESEERLFWQVRIWNSKGEKTPWSSPAFFETGLLKTSDWKAQWIMYSPEDETKASKPAQYFRKEFQTTKSVKSARLYATALGLYELYLNGKKVSKDLFTPGWTSYNKRLQYQTYDVTALIQKRNAIGAVVSDGWYRGYIGFDHQHNYYAKSLGFLVQLRIDYTDGSTQTTITDNSWKTSTNGPIEASDIYNGERYDARKEWTAWDMPGYDDATWSPATVFDHTMSTLVASRSVPVRATLELKPKRLFKTPKGEMVYDFGQNMVGWVRAKLHGHKGDSIAFSFAEVMDKEGNFYTDNLRDAKSTDTYILKGTTNDLFEPHFTFHGFRYMKITGTPLLFPPDSLTGVVIHSDMVQTGHFSCSDTLVNQLQHNIEWGQRGNFLDVPTDCPQRDERLGWTGDAQVFSRTASFNFDTAPFFTKWLADLSADQFDDGRVPHVIPNILNNQGGATAWADASVIIPWNMYLVYNDKQILEKQYPSMKKWVEYMRKRAGDDFIWTEDYHFGDWLAYVANVADYPGATTEKELIATAYFCYSTSLLSKIASILGNTEDAIAYNELAEDIKEAFNKEFVSPNGRLTSHTQTAYVLALAFDLLPHKKKLKAIGFLSGDVMAFGHLTTGFIGTPLLCQTLSDIGRDDLAFMLLTNKSYPSWLYPVLKGATTIWERWDGIRPDGSLQDKGMNSFNHYAYGSIGQWLYSHVAGIDVDEKNPGYKHFLLAPHPGGKLTWVKAEFESVYGNIQSRWTVGEKDFVYEVEIPANTTATVTLPHTSSSNVTMNAQPLGGKGLQTGKDVRVELGSGNYTFAYPSTEFKKAIAPPPPPIKKP